MISKLTKIDNEQLDDNIVTILLDENMKLICLGLLLYCQFVYSEKLQLNVVTESWPPFILADDPVSGKITDNVKEILALTGLNYNVKAYSWALSYQLASSTPNTLIFSISKSAKRQSNFHWFCSLYPFIPINGYKLSSNTKDIDSIESLKKAKIGVMRNDNSHLFLRAKGFVDGVNLDISPNENVNLKKLLNKRVDVIFNAQEAIDHRLNQMGQEAIPLTKGYQLHKEQNYSNCMALQIDSDPIVIDQITKAHNQWLKSRQ